MADYEAEMVEDMASMWYTWPIPSLTRIMMWQGGVANMADCEAEMVEDVASSMWTMTKNDNNMASMRIVRWLR